MAHLIHVGNSMGVRIPKAIIIQAGFNEETELAFQITNDGLLIKPVKSPRQGWKDKFKNLREPLIGEGIVNQFDAEDWEW